MKLFMQVSFILLSMLALTFGMLGVTPAYAAGFVVNTPDDNTNIGDGFCTLREAMASANNAGNGDCGVDSAAADTITFAGNYTITLDGSQLPAVTSAITITGKGAAKTIVRASTCNPVTLTDDSGAACTTPAAYRVFEVSATGNLTLDGLTVKNGKCNGSCIYGGGILSAGALTVMNSSISGNSAISGGGIYSTGALTVTNVTNSAFSGNKANYGGGVYNFFGTMTVTNSAFSGNSALLGGGGIDNTGTLNMANSTLTGNFSDSGVGTGSGGGFQNSSGTATLTNVTISGNQARGASDDGGGGVMVYGGTIHLINSSISGNSAASATGGGGISISAGTVTLVNTLVAGNTSAASKPELSGSFTSNGNNLIGSTDGSTGITNGANGDIAGTNASPVNALVDSLKDNGGPTMTIALLSGSPAIDAGNNVGCPQFDQRGVTRAGNGTACDIGAYETEAQPGPIFIVNTNADTNDLSCDNLGSGIGNKDCSLREAINAANVSAADTITFAASLNGTPITLGSQLPAVATEMTITGNGAANTIVQASTCNPVTLKYDSGEACIPAAYRVFEVSAIGNLTIDGLTVKNGQCSGKGGGILSAGKLTVKDSAFSGNSSDFGGGIYNHYGTLTVMNSTISGNSSDFGGGISTYTAKGSCTDSPATIITNSTLSGNQAWYGGGVYNLNGVMEISYSSITGNKLLTGGSVSGAGVRSYNDVDTCTRVGSSIIAGNIEDDIEDDIGDDVSAFTTEQRFYSLGYNLIGAAGTNVDFAQDFKQTGDHSGVTDPLLGPLGNYNDPTQTVPLLPGSPAIDAAGGCTGLTDQRGVERPQGGTCDIGAYESRGFTLIKNGGDNQSTSINSTFPNMLSLMVKSEFGEPLGGGKVSFTPPDSGASATINVSPMTISSGAHTLYVIATANGIIGGPYKVTASTAGAKSVDFALKNDAPTLSVSILADSIIENAGASATTVTITRNTNTSAELTVNLSSSDTSEATVPATAAIATGQASVTVNLTAVDDAIVDGTQTVTITASLIGFTSGSDTIQVTDNDVLTYTVTYDGNTNTGGAAPVDVLSPYASGATVTVLGNSGSLVKTGSTFNGWNTQADGLGISYAPAATFAMGAANVTLYAKWSAITGAFDPSWYGSVLITADKNVVALGRPHVGSEIASYSGFSAGALTAYIPMLFKNAFGGDYDAALYVQNVDASATANVVIKYYDSATGALTCTDTDTIKPLASTGYWLPTLSAAECLPSGLPVGWVGSAVITSSTANIVAIGRPHINGEVMTYDSFSSGSLTSYLPMLFNSAFGGEYNSAFYVQNVDPSVNAAVTIKYYNSLTGALTCTATDTITPLASTGYWLPTAKCLYAASTTPALLPAGWVGSVVVTSSAAPIVSVGRPHVGTQITAYNGFAASGLSSYIPMLFRKAYAGAYDSALYVQNVGAVDAAITIKYYKSDGTLTCTDTDTIKPLASTGYWLPTLSAAECAGGLPDDWIGGVVVTSTSANIVAVGRAHIGAQVTAYNGFSSGNSNYYLPMLFKNKWGYDSAFYIQNTETAEAAVTVKFYDADGNLSCVRRDSIPALSTLGYWVPSVTCE